MEATSERLTFSFRQTATQRLTEERNEKTTKDWGDGEYCTLCHNGGDVLYGCERCPRIYHLSCYIPALSEEPPEDFVCLMCANNDELEKLPNKPKTLGDNRWQSGLRDLHICRRLTMEMLDVWPECNTFRNLKTLDFPLYRKNIQTPIALDLLKEKLDINNSEQYLSVKDYTSDVRLMFRNCRAFWEELKGGALYIKQANKLEERFDKKLREVDYMMNCQNPTKPPPSQYSTDPVPRKIVGPASKKLQFERSAQQLSVNKSPGPLSSTAASPSSAIVNIVQEKDIEDDFGGDDFVVEKVVNKRVTGGKVEYLLKWKGYSHGDNTWEYEDRLHCQDLIKEYEKDKEKCVDIDGESDEEEYIVEKIVDKRLGKNNNAEYLVKWRGYSEKDNTWEALKTLKCKDIIDEFEKGDLDMQRMDLNSQYVVEKIVQKRVNENGKTEYFIKWKGYDDDDSSWEPSNTLHCKELIEEYERKKTPGPASLKKPPGPASFKKQPGPASFKNQNQPTPEIRRPGPASLKRVP